MSPLISFEEVTSYILIIWLPFLRISGFFITAPFFSDNMIPRKIRLGIALCIALVIAPLNEPPTGINPFSVQAVFMSLLQIGYGALLGFILALFFTIFTMAGQAISMQMGMAMAIQADPSNGQSNGIIARIFAVLCMLLFLAYGGHIGFLLVFIESFNVLPIVADTPYAQIEYVASLLGWTIKSAVVLAMPIVIIMLISNFTFGLMNRATPALNVFALGFPMTILIGLIALGLTIPAIGNSYTDLVTTALNHFEIFIHMESVT
ncbi:flagellar biosynthetic protein FliR [Vibrio breoganii]